MVPMVQNFLPRNVSDKPSSWAAVVGVRAADEVDDAAGHAELVVVPHHQFDSVPRNLRKRAGLNQLGILKNFLGKIFLEFDSKDS
jgi:hypothetical protein